MGRSFVMLALLLVYSRSAGAADEERRLPDSVHLPPELRVPVARMLAQSETFRRQCRRIAETPLITVWIRVNPLMGAGSYRARTTIHRYRSGYISAVVEVSLHSPVEWIAHEFEHVLEQVDGVDVAALADRRDGAWRTGDVMFETVRAIDAGRAVVRETSAQRARSDKFVE